MTSAIVVKRYRCWDEQNIKRSLYHETLLQITGPPEEELHYISKKMAPLGYKLSCNCPICLSYTQELRTDSVIDEPMAKGLGVTFTTLTKIGYDLKSTSVTQNYDQSTTCTWVWIKKPKVSNI